MTDTLYLPLKGIYFDQIKAGEKLHEYRLATPYWRARLDNPARLQAVKLAMEFIEKHPLPKSNKNQMPEGK